MKHQHLSRIALSLEGTTEVPHGERRAFRTRTIYATLAPDSRTANIKLGRDEQEHWCALLGEGLSPVPNKWGLQGWTCMALDLLEEGEIETLVRLAWAGTQRPNRKTRKGA